MRPSFIDHIVVVVRGTSKELTQFCGAFLGSPVHRDDVSIAYVIGEIGLFFVLPHGQSSMVKGTSVV